jgi:hypothetical protein
VAKKKSTFLWKFSVELAGDRSFVSAYSCNDRLELVGPKFKTRRCHKMARTVEDVKKEIARWFHVEYESVEQLR